MHVILVKKHDLPVSYEGTKLKKLRILFAFSLLALMTLISTGCGDEGFIVISAGNGVIIFTPNSSSKR